MDSVNKKQALIDQTLVQLQEHKIINVEFKISTLQHELTDKFQEVKDLFKIFENIPELAPLQNEQYFRSMLLGLRNEISALKDDYESLKKNNNSAPMQIDNPINFEDFQEPLQLSMIQSILKQHDTAIRIIAGRSAVPSKPEDYSGKIDETAFYLHHLEDLKKEMKEILSKQEETKKLSTKDLEIIQNILNSVESKIGKEELSQMAEKNELHKIYRMLKRRIDELAEEFKQKKELKKEEAFFLKRKFSTDCASCGQILPDRQEFRISHEYWNKFPLKTPTYAVGFSRILNSLVPSPSGGLTLSTRNEAKTTVEGKISPKLITSKKQSRKILSRINIDANKKSL